MGAVCFYKWAVLLVILKPFCDRTTSSLALSDANFDPLLRKGSNEAEKVQLEHSFIQNTK